MACVCVTDTKRQGKHQGVVFLQVFHENVVLFTAFYICWQTDTESGGDAAEACGNSREKQQRRDLFLSNESGELE